MKYWFLLIFLLSSLVFSQKISAVFLGVIPGEAPEFEERLDILLGEHIATIEGLDIADYDDTQYLKHKTDFASSPGITRSFVKSLLEIVDDRTIVIWGKVADYSIEPKRKFLVGAEAVGSMTLSLTLYSTAFREYVYLGNVVSTASISLSPVFFQRVDKVSHISASDRCDINESMMKKAAEKSSMLINSIVRSQLMKAGVMMDKEVEVKKQPSVSDLFDIPTVEAPDVGNKSSGKNE